MASRGAWIGIGLALAGAAVGIGLFWPYTLPRSKVTEVAAIAGACKVALTYDSYNLVRKAFPKDAAEAGCALDDYGVRYASGIRVTPGRIDVTMHRIHDAVDGKVLTLQAMTGPEGPELASSPERVGSWKCGTNADPKAYRYFPANCRQPN
jgi:type IV pilus assembly protein PilA